jgi:hypothetical protein
VSDELAAHVANMLARGGAASVPDAVVLELPREERAKNAAKRDTSRQPHPAVPALTWGCASGASWNRTSDLILIRDAL